VDKPWFDREQGILLFDEYLTGLDSYRRIMEDEIITDTEFAEQTRRVVSLLQQLEAVLPPDAKAIATDALCELAVLNALQAKRLQTTSGLPKEIGF
jgi:flagellin-specific chaperone FliS